MALPPNWSKYTTDEGKEYFHNAVTNATQWEEPSWPQMGGAPFDAAATADVFQYQPTASELESPSLAALGGAGGGGSGTTGFVPQASAGGFGASGPSAFDSEMVSLNSAPGGKLASSSPAAGGGSASAGGGGASDLFSGLAMGALAGAIGVGGGGASGASGAGSSEGASGSADPAGGAANWLLGHAQRLFDVTTDDVVARLRLALMPYPAPSSGAKEDLRARPDFYGPFWVATTAVLFLAATGNFARLVETGDHKAFKADYGLVSLAAFVIYGCLIAVPVVARASLFMSGEEADSIDFRQLICVCGYSLAPAIPVSMLCIIPFDAIRWLAVLAGLVLSLLFLRWHLLADVTVQVAWVRYVMLIAPCVMPVAVFFMYRVHFFTAKV